MLIYLVEDSQDAPIFLGVRYEKLYRSVGQPVTGTSGFLELDTDSDLEPKVDRHSVASSSLVREGDP